MMDVEQSVEWALQGKPKYSEKTCPSATLSTTNPTGSDPGSNLGHRGGKIAYVLIKIRTKHILKKSEGRYQQASPAVKCVKLPRTKSSVLWKRKRHQT
jgi:hypothetical protein